MPDIRNPHDKFFRATFARRGVAADFARHYLPPDVVSTLNLETLQPAKDSFVDEELRDHFTDLLYETHLQDDALAYIYLLFEHKCGTSAALPGGGGAHIAARRFGGSGSTSFSRDRRCIDADDCPDMG